MKKIIIAILAVTFILGGCGNESTKDREDLIEKLEKMDYAELEKNIQNANYTKVENFDVVLYVKTDGIEGDTITMDEMLEFLQAKDRVEAYYVTIFEEDNFFEAAFQEQMDDGRVFYYVTVGSGDAELSIGILKNEMDTTASAKFKYKDGELKLVEELQEGDEFYEEYQELLDTHEKSAKEFFQKALDELETIVK